MITNRTRLEAIIVPVAACRITAPGWPGDHRASQIFLDPPAPQEPPACAWPQSEYDPARSVGETLSFREQSGGFDLLGVDKSGTNAGAMVGLVY
jgi:hypothetical protein